MPCNVALKVVITVFSLFLVINTLFFTIFVNATKNQAKNNHTLISVMNAKVLALFAAVVAVSYFMSGGPEREHKRHEGKK